MGMANKSVLDTLEFWIKSRKRIGIIPWGMRGWEWGQGAARDLIEQIKQRIILQKSKYSSKINNLWGVFVVGGGGATVNILAKTPYFSLKKLMTFISSLFLQQTFKQNRLHYFARAWYNVRECGYSLYRVYEDVRHTYVGFQCQNLQTWVSFQYQNL